jgi:glucosamine-6-phosphate deaminase
VTIRIDVLPAEAWADDVARALAGVIRRRPTLRVCLPTGDTPGPLYARLVEMSSAGLVSFAGVEIVMLDEYVGLSPGSPARCEVRLRRELVSALRPPPAAFHTIELDRLDPAAGGGGPPWGGGAGGGRLDLALLGIGTNGHVGFNEPGSTPESTTRVVALADESREASVERYGAERPPEVGVTLGLARLLAAREIWLLVTGERKAAVLARALDGEMSNDCPASQLQRHRRLRVFADEPAASRLARRGA